MPPLSAATRLSLSLIAGGAVANIYYNQPLLGLLVQVFGHDASVLVPTATLAGYGVGILGLVPLGDKLARRSLIVGQLLLLAAVLVLAAGRGATGYRQLEPGIQLELWPFSCCYISMGCLVSAMLK